MVVISQKKKGQFIGSGLFFFFIWQQLAGHAAAICLTDFAAHVARDFSVNVEWSVSQWGWLSARELRIWHWCCCIPLCWARLTQPTASTQGYDSPTKVRKYPAVRLFNHRQATGRDAHVFTCVAGLRQQCIPATDTGDDTERFKM